MREHILSKDIFIEIMDDLKAAGDYQEGLNKYFKTHNVDGYIFQPDCSCSLIKLLHIIFGEADKEEWIEKFCFNLNYGRKWKNGMFAEEYGEEVNLSSPEELYELLTKHTGQE